jgi:predicted transcriptional regulator of viral defense system
MTDIKYQLIQKIIKKKPVFRPRDLAPYGIPREYLNRLCEQGIIEKVRRGLYIYSGLEIDEHFSLVQVSKMIPNSTICLLSALHFHHLTTQLPFEVWIAISNQAHYPKVDDLPVRIWHFSGQALTMGRQQYTIHGVKLSVYNPAKTIADCFKYRHKIGLEVALEALREGWRERRCTMAELQYYGKICRVAKIMRPYLEFLT